MKTPKAMKPNTNEKFSRHGVARVASRHLLALILCLFALPCLLSAQTLQHDWSFNEPSGSTTATDSVAGANITLLGSTSLGGGVLTLPGGGGNYAQFPNGILSTNNSITIETWLTDNAGQTWSRAWSFGGSTTGPNNNFIQNNYIDLIPKSGPGPLWTEFNHNGNVDAEAAAQLPTGTEQYTVVTYDAPSQTVRLYLNGVQVAIATGVTITPASLGFTYNNYIGLDQWNDAVFNGTFDEMRIWTAPVSQRYLSASVVAGPGVVINNLTPTSASLTAGPGVVITGTEQATFTVTLPQTGASVLLATSDATNWISSNPGVLAVNSSGLATGVGVGSATVSATVGGVTATSSTITVTGPQTLLHRYSFASDASDSVGGATGTLVGPNGGSAATISSGLILPGGGGGAPAAFSGYLSLPNGILTNTTSVTVECWLTQNNANTWATPWAFANNGSQNFALIPHPGNNGGNMQVAFTPNGGEIDLASSVSFPNGSEQYVATTYNNYTLTGNLYNNGALIATQTFPNTGYCPGGIGGAGGTTQNWLGADTYGDAQFQGTIYEFRIWNGAVSPVYLAASKVAGPSVVVTNTTPQSLTVSVTTSMIGSQTQQATVTGSFIQVANVPLTSTATNWTSSQPSTLTVNSSGLITAVNGGTATVSATVNGVTAVSAPITVSSTAPTITQGPVSQTNVVGDNLSFNVQALGGSLSYQWSNNINGVITGATNATLNLTNVAFADAGTYSVFVTNSQGSTNASAVLSVVSQLLLHRYSFVSDASDSVGGANGTIVPPNGGSPVTINHGLTLPGGGGNNNGYVSLPSGILTNTTSLTIECWVTQNQVYGWATVWDFANNNNVNFEMCPNPLRNINNLDVAITPNGNEIDTVTGALFPSGSQQYVSFTFTAPTLTAQIYTNGLLGATQVYPNATYIPASIGGAGGTTVNALGNDIYNDTQFQGTIYEFRIWNGVVSPLYLAVSAAAGPSVVVSSLTPTAVHISVNTSQVGGQTQQASATADFTGASGVPVTGSVTNWISSNPGVLTVNSNGVITAGNVGSATVSATLNGVTGTSALITISTSGPIITQQPTPSVTLLAGATLTASVANIGTAPFVYYWYTNLATAPISISGSPTLTLPNVQAINSGTYTCVVSNQYSTAPSSTLSLAVVTPTTYQGVMVSLEPLGYWPLNESSGTTAYDVIGGYNGTYTLSTVLGSSISLGQPGPGDAFFGNANSAQFLSAYVDIPEGPFNINGAITVLEWVQLQVTPGFDGLVGHGDTSWRMTVNGGGQTGANDGLTSYSTNNPFGDATDPIASPGINDGNWHMVAYTYTGNTAQTNNGTLYVDGVPVAGNTILTASGDNHLDVWIAGAPDYGTARLLAGGNIANVAIFNRALTAAQIQGINTGVYVPNSSRAIGISRSGSSVVLTWTSGNLLQAPAVTGPWTTNNAAVSPYTVPATAGNQFFKTIQ
jgi:hypothetical protein